MRDAQAFGDLCRDSAGMIAQDLICVRCGYNLRGISPEGVCPECGTPIGRSVRGNLLEFADPDWVERISGGMKWVVGAVGVRIACGVFAGYATGPLGLFGVTAASADILFWIVRQASELVLVAGLWRATEADPGEPQAESMESRQIARYALAAAMLASLIVGLAGGSAELGLILIAQGIRLVGLLAISRYAASLALRIPDKPLARHTQIVVWGLAITEGCVLLLMAAMASLGGAAPSGVQSAGACLLVLLGLAWVVFGLCMIGIVINFRGKLNECALMARYTWAKSTRRDPDWNRPRL
jgi:hypothetical protein